ncbi:MAG: phosphotransferase [Phycisphaerales bacterium]|nr:phosphotransferase [Phycisphaerales bacterium]
MSTELDVRGGQEPNLLAAAILPQLVEECRGCLHDPAWFRTDWQRGGAATATATWRHDDGTECGVILKFPVVERELRWTRQLQSPDDDPSPIVPRLFASGDTLAGYDIAWVVIEGLPHGPLGTRWHDDHIPRLADAAARFSAAAQPYEVDRVPIAEPWDEILEEAAKSVKVNRIHDEQRWTGTLKSLGKVADRVVREWRSRPITEWIHGDLHFANAMSRESMDAGPVTLIDFAEVRAGHWVEDAVYVERQLWARAERLATNKPVRLIAKARKELGLPVDELYPRLATIRRALYAAAAPKYIRSEGSPRHLAACLERLEAALPELK